MSQINQPRPHLLTAAQRRERCACGARPMDNHYCTDCYNRPDRKAARTYWLGVLVDEGLAALHADGVYRWSRAGVEMFVFHNRASSPMGWADSIACGKELAFCEHCGRDLYRRQVGEHLGQRRLCTACARTGHHLSPVAPEQVQP